MPSLLRSASWRCRLRQLDPRSRRGLQELTEDVEFVHVVRMPATGVVYVFVHDRRKLAKSFFEAFLPAGAWRVGGGPGGASAFWDLGGRHSVYGLEPSPGARVDLQSPAFLVESRLVLAGDASANLAVTRGVRLVELWAGKGRVSQVVSERRCRAIRVG